MQCAIAEGMCELPRALLSTWHLLAFVAASSAMLECAGLVASTRAYLVCTHFTCLNS
jgi:hypothetical protein